MLAEELGYSHLWFADSQMLWSDCYATMALAAARTERIRIGTGVAVAGTRSSAVTAAAHATINRLAPGRVFCAVGTGNTAMPRDGRPADADRRVRALHRGAARACSTASEADVAFRGGTRPVRHLMPDAGFVAFEPRIPLYVSGLRAAGDGPRRAPRRRARDVDPADASTASSGRGRASTPPPPTPAPPSTASTFLTCTLTTMVVLQPGETIDDATGCALACGAFAIAALHYLYEQWKEAGRPDRPAGVRGLGPLRRHARRTPTPSACTSASTRATTAG